VYRGGDRFKKDFLSLETIETWIVFMGKTKDLSAFERCSSCQVHVSKTTGFFTTVSQRTFSQLDTTVGKIGVNTGQHPCGMLVTPCRVHALTN
jgi:hypothetical protein